ncbi:MAG TPA: VTT domain-containing protein [Flavisolibacter sp.]|jgi:membrane-associated protein|nr:VTT domain-containing protein [Flavisolibacter sp.]
MFDAESLIQYGGLLLVCLAVFCQTGLFFCFFLPSGGLLFAAGVLVASGRLDQNIIIVCLLLIVSAILGNTAGYAFGRKTGPRLYSRKNSRFFRKEHLQTAENFFQRYGGVAVMAALFFPVVRTFAPIVAGLTGMRFRRFFVFTAIGSSAWILTFVLAGFLIGNVPALKPYLLYIILATILLFTIPILISVTRKLKTADRSASPNQPAAKTSTL